MIYDFYPYDIITTKNIVVNSATNAFDTDEILGLSQILNDFGYRFFIAKKSKIQYAYFNKEVKFNFSNENMEFLSKNIPDLKKITLIDKNYEELGLNIDQNLVKFEEVESLSGRGQLIFYLISKNYINCDKIRTIDI